jgi:hypothetical protein
MVKLSSFCNSRLALIFIVIVLVFAHGLLELDYVLRQYYCSRKYHDYAPSLVVHDTRSGVP